MEREGSGDESPAGSVPNRIALPCGKKHIEPLQQQDAKHPFMRQSNFSFAIKKRVEPRTPSRIVLALTMSDLPEPRTAKTGNADKKKRSAPAHNATDLPFEAALEKLETIVESLENGDVALADLLSRYEEASGLLKSCQQQLDAAQLRIERLSRKGDHEQLEPFTPEA